MLQEACMRRGNASPPTMRFCCAGTSCSITILLFFFFATIYLKFVMPTWVLILLSLTGDLSCMAVSLDKVIQCPLSSILVFLTSWLLPFWIASKE